MVQGKPEHPFGSQPVTVTFGPRYMGMIWVTVCNHIHIYRATLISHTLSIHKGVESQQMGWLGRPVWCVKAIMAIAEKPNCDKPQKALAQKPSANLVSTVTSLTQ
jgi:hypothetical protein